MIDDLIAALVGGTVNLVINLVQGNVHSVGQGFAYFGVGAAGGVLTLYITPVGSGAFLGASNSLLSQGFNAGWENVSWSQVGMSALVGGITGYVGGQLGSMASRYVGPWWREHLQSRAARRADLRHSRSRHRLHAGHRFVALGRGELGGSLESGRHRRTDGFRRGDCGRSCHRLQVCP